MVVDRRHQLRKRRDNEYCAQEHDEDDTLAPSEGPQRNDTMETAGWRRNLEGGRYL